MIIDELDDPSGGDESTTASQQFTLPHSQFEGLWESLYLPSSMKESLLSYCASSMLFSSHGVDKNLVTCNRVLLLHGPPGTGKTTLCRALAQIATIRLSNIYQQATFVEVNPHSLFSKWFSESGKLVQKLFERIEELASDSSSLVFVLIDEVESLASDRGASEGEPGDAIRSVNAVLTQIDKLSKYENVLLLCTSNLTNAVDKAFLDRADVQQYIGPPSLEARYEILRTSLKALQKSQILQEVPLLPYKKFIDVMPRWVEKIRACPSEGGLMASTRDPTSTSFEYPQDSKKRKIDTTSLVSSQTYLKTVLRNLQALDGMLLAEPSNNSLVQNDQRGKISHEIMFRHLPCWHAISQFGTKSVTNSLANTKGEHSFDTLIDSRDTSKSSHGENSQHISTPQDFSQHDFLTKLRFLSGQSHGKGSDTESTETLLPSSSTSLDHSASDESDPGFDIFTAFSLYCTKSQVKLSGVNDDLERCWCDCPIPSFPPITITDTFEKTVKNSTFHLYLFMCVMKKIREDCVQFWSAFGSIPSTLQQVDDVSNTTFSASSGLLLLAIGTAGLSGRSLRKLAFVAHARGLSGTHAWSATIDSVVPFSLYLQAIWITLKNRAVE